MAIIGPTGHHPNPYTKIGPTGNETNTLKQGQQYIFCRPFDDVFLHVPTGYNTIRMLRTASKEDLLNKNNAVNKLNNQTISLLVWSDGETQDKSVTHSFSPYGAETVEKILQGRCLFEGDTIQLIAQLKSGYTFPPGVYPTGVFPTGSNLTMWEILFGEESDNRWKHDINLILPQSLDVYVVTLVNRSTQNIAVTTTIKDSQNNTEIYSSSLKSKATIQIQVPNGSSCDISLFCAGYTVTPNSISTSIGGTYNISTRRSDITPVPNDMGFMEAP